MIAIPNDPRRFVFHVVRKMIDVQPDRLWDTDHRMNRLVFIGKKLDQAHFQKEFLSCIA